MTFTFAPKNLDLRRQRICIRASDVPARVIAQSGIFNGLEREYHAYEIYFRIFSEQAG